MVLVRRYLLLGRRQRIDVGDDQRPRAFIGEHLGENAFRRLVGHDMYAAYTAADRVFDRFRLRQHAVDDALLFAQALEAVEIGVRDDRGRIVDTLENARRARAQHEFLGRQRRTDGGGHGVRIDVEQRALVVGRQWADDRHEAVVEQ